MACNGCGEAPAMTKEQVENLIQTKIDEGKIQGGLLSCGGEKLPAQSQVLLCSQLAGKVKELIKDGTIDVVTDVEIKDDKLVVTDGTGKEVRTSLPYLKGVATEKALVVTLPDGSTVEVPKASSALTEDSFDETIEKGANKPNKFGVKLKDKGGLERTVDGIAVKLGDGVTFDGNGAIQLGEVFVEKPLKGKGTKADPLTVLLNERDFVVNPATGELSLKVGHPTEITNLNKATPVLGHSTFFGVIDKSRGKYVIGVPADINSTVENQNPTEQVSELKDGEAYDFNGWQIASSVQVDQYLVGTDRAVWHRVNDGGMNDDGSLKDPNGWSVWHRETNVAVSVVQTQQMQNQINDLTNRVSALEKLLAGLIPLKDASGTVQLGLIKS